MWSTLALVWRWTRAAVALPVMILVDFYALRMVNEAVNTGGLNNPFIIIRLCAATIVTIRAIPLIAALFLQPRQASIIRRACAILLILALVAFPYWLWTYFTGPHATCCSLLQSSHDLPNTIIDNFNNVGKTFNTLNNSL